MLVASNNVYEAGSDASFWISGMAGDKKGAQGPGCPRCGG